MSIFFIILFFFSMLVASVDISKPVELVWKHYTTSESITKWNFCSDEWECPKASIDLQENGRFDYLMQTKDGKIKFNYAGHFDTVKPHELIELHGDDGRSSTIKFESKGSSSVVTETFVPDPSMPNEEQLEFCQGVLNNLKILVEST